MDEMRTMRHTKRLGKIDMDAKGEGEKTGLGVELMEE